MKLPAPTRKHREIPPCPQAGEGVHGWLMEAGWVLRFNGESAEQAGRYLADKMTRSPGPRNEVEQVIAKVYNDSIIIGAPETGWQARKPKWPEPDRENIESVAASGFTLVDLWEASPVRVDDEPPQTAGILRAMFPGDPLLCVGSRSNFATIQLSRLGDAASSIEQVVPSPMLAKHGKTQDGRISQHTLDATGPRRFLVVEGDKLDGIPIPKDTQAGVLLHLSKSAPLALVVDSGGKSLHGWFYVAGKSDEQLTPFFRKACKLGADRALWTRSQFARMPDGTRENGNRQHVLFFNPSVIKP